MREQQSTKWATAEDKRGRGRAGSPFREKEELPWTAGRSSELWMEEEYSHTREV